MHGLKESAKTLKKMVKWVEDEIPGVYILNCEVGNGVLSSMDMDIAR